MPLETAAKFLTLAALLSGLAIPAVLPEAGNIGYFVIAGLALLLFSLTTPWRQVLARPAVAMPLAAGLLLTLCFAITADSPLDSLAAVFFVPLFLVAPMTELFRRAPKLVTPATIGIAASLGCLAAAGVALYDRFVLHLPRAGSSVNNPIHFADIALMLGFVALVGLYTARVSIRVLAVLALLAAMVAVLLSGARGALVAIAPLSLAAVIVLFLHFGGRARTLLYILLTVIIAVALAAMAAAFVPNLRFDAFMNAIDALRGRAVDGSTMQRLVMYQSAWNAFLASPVFGHGLIGFIEATAQYVPQGATFPTYEHLHSDLADFAVIGGALGLVAYAAFLLAPAVDAMTASRAHARPAALYLAVVVPVGYAAMGLTNAMFGVLTQTILYGFCLALVAHLARGEERIGVSGRRQYAPFTPTPKEQR